MRDLAGLVGAAFLGVSHWVSHSSGGMRVGFASVNRGQVPVGNRYFYHPRATSFFGEALRA